MARKRVAISSGGGIQAGAPFVLDGALFIQQATPPVANSGRLGRLADANQSLIAPGVLAGPTAFVMGPGVVDSTKGNLSVLIGRNITQNTSLGVLPDAQRQILIGQEIDMSALSINCQDLIVIGYQPSFPVLGVQPDKSTSVLIGNFITGATPNQNEPFRDNVLIGYNANGTGGNLTALGQLAKTWTGGTAIGSQSQAAQYSVAIGYQAQQSNTGAGADAGIVIGYRAKVSNGSIAIGFEAGFQSLLTQSILIGWNAGALNVGQTVNTNNVILLGRECICNVNDTTVIGSALFPMPRITFGAGERADGTVVGSTGQTFIVENTFVVGGVNNQKGNALAIRAGTGTGNWPNAENLGLDLQAGLVQASGIARQTPSSVLAIRHSDLNVALWGGLGATMGSGIKVLFVANAATAPTVPPVGGGLLYVNAGSLHWLGSGGTDTPIAPA